MDVTGVLQRPVCGKLPGGHWEERVVYDAEGARPCEVPTHLEGTVSGARGKASCCQGNASPSNKSFYKSTCIFNKYT